MTFYDFMTMCGSFGFIKEEYFGGKNVQIILYIYIYIHTHAYAYSSFVDLD